MPIKAKNIIVGGETPPTVPVIPKEEKVVQSFSEIRNNTVKPVYAVKQKSVEVVEDVKSSKYIEKTDGVLVRHINTKSNYLKDVLDLDS